MASQFILSHSGVYLDEPATCAAFRPARRAQLNYTPGASTETVEEMMVRLHQQFPEDMKLLAE